MSNLIKNHNSIEKQPFKYRSPHPAGNYNSVDRRNTNKKSNYSSSERRSGNERRGVGREYKEKNTNTDISTIINRLIPVLEKFVANTTTDNKQNAEIEQQKIDTEQRKLDIIENMGKLLLDKLSINITSVSETDTDSSIKKNKIFNQPKNQKKKEALDIITTMRSDGKTYEKIADRLSKEGFSTFSGRGEWHAQTVHRICQAME